MCASRSMTTVPRRLRRRGAGWPSASSESSASTIARSASPIAPESAGTCTRSWHACCPRTFSRARPRIGARRTCASRCTPACPRSHRVPPLWAAAEPLDAPRVDREVARGLLAAAGFRTGRLGILERGAERMTVTLQVATGSQARIDAGRRLSGDLASVGIAATVLERSPAEVLDAVGRGDFDLALVPERTDDPQLASDRYRGLAGPWFDVLLD